MSRLVQAKPRELSARQAAVNSGSSPAKDYLERVAKYVPAEIIAAYTTMNALLITLPGKLQFWSLLAELVILTVLTPVYFKWISKPDDEPSLRTQQWVSGIAFMIWAYNFSGDKGIFGNAGFHIYYQALGAAFMILFSLVSGTIVPKK